MTKPMPHQEQDVPTADLLVRSRESEEKRAHKTRRSSRLVRGIRLVLPVVALAILVVLVFWPEGSGPIKAVPRDQVSPQTVSRNELVNPVFHAESGDSQPYTITADKAVQNRDDMDLIRLEQPRASINLKGGRKVDMQSVSGAYDQKSGLLKLGGTVKVADDTGYELQTEQMDIDINGQVLRSDRAVSGQGPAGQISAQGLEADTKTDKVIFKGPATLILKQDKDSGRGTEKNQE